MRPGPGRYIGRGSLAPGRQHGFTNWAQSKSTKSAFSDDKRRLMRWVFDVYSELGNRGTLWMEASSPEEESTRTQIFLKGLEKYKDDLGPKISAFKRWAEYCAKEGIDHYYPSVVQLGGYLMHKRSAGPTAALGARNTLEWWRVHVGVPIPSNNPSLDSFKQIETGHVVDDGIAPEPWMLFALLQLAHAGRGPISTLAALFVTFAGTCMR